MGCFQIRSWEIRGYIRQHKRQVGEEGKPVNHPNATAGDGYGRAVQQTDRKA